jgi:signal transduction histidine kinase
MWDVEAQLITRDGEEKWTHAIARPHRLPDGSVLWDGVILDNTWIKKVEFELRKAKEAAEASSTAKTEFLAQMSHELRTPLNAIIGFSEILQTQCFGTLGDEKYMDYASHINASGVHLLETINDILEFTKLETGEIRLFESKVDISETLDTAIKQIMPFAEMTNINISGSSDENLPFLYGDDGKIRKIVTNLLSNAVKFTPQGGDVEIAAKTDDAGNLVITITDTGIGIPTEDIAKIFEAFGQIDSDLNRRYEGLGLGIPLAIKMAKLHGAHLTFDSEVGVGTTVAFIFPRARVLNGPDNGASALRPQLTLDRDRDETAR